MIQDLGHCKIFSEGTIFEDNDENSTLKRENIQKKGTQQMTHKLSFIFLFLKGNTQGI